MRGRNFFRRFLGVRKKRLKGIPSPEEFWNILEEERARADRIGYELSLLVFQLGIGGDPCAITEPLLQVLEGRVRSFDQVGWWNKQEMGVLLAGASAEGAWKFADDVRQKVAVAASELPFRLYTYPTPLFPKGEEDGFSFRPGEGRVQKEVQRLESLFVYQLPAWKRAVDILGSSLLIVILLPVFAIVALWIAIVSPGPALYKQRRIGNSGRPFTIWKFRTMKASADESVHRQHVEHLIKSGEPMTKLDSLKDPRIIPLGNLFRRLGIDEFPQLINVLRGEMSLVGPRPDVPYSVRYYLPWQTRRLETNPGLTGLWQVSGKNKTTFKDMVRLDIRYTMKRSFLSDLRILVLTIPSILDQIVWKALKEKQQVQ